MSARYPTGGRQPWFNTTIELRVPGPTNVYGEVTAGTDSWFQPAHVQDVTNEQDERLVGGIYDRKLTIRTGNHRPIQEGWFVRFDEQDYEITRVGKPYRDYRGDVHMIEIEACRKRGQGT